MLHHGSSLSAVRERRIEYELSYDRPTGADAALPPFKNTLGHLDVLTKYRNSDQIYDKIKKKA